MAIEKMSLVNLVGNLSDVDRTLLSCLDCGYFHPEVPIHQDSLSNGFTIYSGENPYISTLNVMQRISDSLKLEFEKGEAKTDDINFDEIRDFVNSVDNDLSGLIVKKRELKENIYQHEQAIIQIKHLAGLNVSFDDVFACMYVKVRVGRLPVESFSKLNYYDNKTFFFFPFDHNDEYYWGVYFAPATKIAVIDDIFTSLYFERVRVPDYVHGTPEIATSNINSLLAKERAELNVLNQSIDNMRKKSEKRLQEMYAKLKRLSTAFELRKYVATVHDRFYMVGFIPTAKEKEFKKMFDQLDSISCVFKPHDADPTLIPPVKLKNSRFAQPFEMFVNMYSLPSHKDIDPTSLVAITYTILFGVMFGDLGQGLALALVGVILSRWKKMNLGRILIRIGASSAVFGVLYGSVFGFEELLDPFYKGVFGLATKPIHVFDTDTTNVLLIGAIGIGALLIVISIAINIVLGFKHKDYERAVFGHNGIAGLTLYVSAIAAAVSALMFKVNLLTPLYVILFIILPILMIFLREPLTKLVTGHKDFMPHNIGEFVIENFFELFEYVLSYLSNSMSFLRVGGFILSHAGMMAVVMSLSEMAGGAASPIVIIIGNIFVMCLEGLIVGIQVLRLEFYEIFSRNFEGNGKPFEPAVVAFDGEK